MIRDIPPRELHLGLLEAVRWHAKRFTSSFAVQVIADGTLADLPPDVELAVYRIVGEALTNISRHAKAGSCQIRITRADVLELTIVDDGDGISKNPSSGIGLGSMRKRCEDLKGHVHYHVPTSWNSDLGPPSTARLITFGRSTARAGG